jgi:hypothetical protein
MEPRKAIQACYASFLPFLSRFKFIRSEGLIFIPCINSIYVVTEILKGILYKFFLLILNDLMESVFTGGNQKTIA